MDILDPEEARTRPTRPGLWDIEVMNSPTDDTGVDVDSTHLDETGDWNENCKFADVGPSSTLKRRSKHHAHASKNLADEFDNCDKSGYHLSEIETPTPTSSKPCQETISLSIPIFLQIITKFVSKFGSKIANICPILHENLAQSLQSLDGGSGLSDLELRTAIRNSAGYKTQYLFPEVAFDLLMKRKIRELRDPSLQCLTKMYQEMERGLQKCSAETEQLFQRHPSFTRFMNGITDHVTEVLKKNLARTRTMVEDLVDIELAYIYTMHPDFHKKVAEMQPLLLVNHPHKERNDCKIMETLITSYFTIVRNRIEDSAWKAIMHFLVNPVQVDLTQELVSKFAKVCGPMI